MTFSSLIALLWIGMQDLWDSIQNNEYFSVEGAKDIIKQVRDAQVTLSCSTDYKKCDIYTLLLMS